MKLPLIISFVLLLSACDTRYSPSQEVQQLKITMTPEQAIAIMQTQIWDNEAPVGICGSRDFWFDTHSDMRVSKDKVSMLSHRRGKQLKHRGKKYDNLVVFEKEYYKYEFLFNKITVINVYDDPLLLPVFPNCNKANITDEYLIIDLYISELSNLKFIVFKKDFNKSMAALAILMPTTPVYIK